MKNEQTTSATVSPSPSKTNVVFRTRQIKGLNVFYREAGDPSAPKLVLLGGFPASSHQFRLLMPELAERFHVISPDYPGFGNTDMPDTDKFTYTFDNLAEVVEALLVDLQFSRFGLFVQDYGGPIGFRIAGRHPEWLEWLAVQNSNAYEEGFSAAWDGFRNALWKNRTPETEAPLLGFLQLDAIKSIYLHGHKDPSLISPDNWNVDFRFMERPNARKVQMELFWDYRTNPENYPKWQQFLRDQQPKTILFWGQGDIFFTPEGGEAFLRDLPNAEMHRLDSGHFAVEDFHGYIADRMIHFYDANVK